MRKGSSKTKGSQKKKGSPKQRRKFRIHPFILFIVILGASVFPLLELVDWFTGMQLDAFSSLDRLMFVHSKYTLYLLILLPFVVGFCITSRFDGGRHRKLFSIDIYTILTIFFTMAGILLLWNDFYHYTNFSMTEIRTREGIMDKETRYDWKDVQEADISYGVDGKGNVSIDYELTFSNGKTLNLVESAEFFERILKTDHFMKYLGITVNRMEIAQDDLGYFEKTYRGPGSADVDDRLEIVLQLFPGQKSLLE